MTRRGIEPVGLRGREMLPSVAVLYRITHHLRSYHNGKNFFIK